MNKGYVVIDSGGSKVLVAVFSEELELLSCIKGSAGNPHFKEQFVIEAETKLLISSALNEAKILVDDVLAVCGVYMLKPDGYERLSEYLKATYKNASIVRLDEKFCNLIASTGEFEGTIAHAGTGSFAYNRTDGKALCYGGLGSYLGDEGAGHYIGLNTFKACVYSLDGRGEKTIMADMLAEKWSVDASLDFNEIIWGLARDVLTPSPTSKSKISSLAVLCEQAARLGDNVAVKIYDNAARDLFLLLEVLFEKMNAKPFGKLSTSGSIWRAGDILLKPFLCYVNEKYPSLTFVEPKFEPVIGGLIYITKDTSKSAIERFAFANDKIKKIL